MASLKIAAEASNVSTNHWQGKQGYLVRTVRSTVLSVPCMKDDG